MAVKVLVVDDSGFFRRRVSEILSADPSIQVVGTATNGREAIDQALALKPDVITMDYEMPMMDGITAVRNIMQRCPTPVLMFSSLTHEGARVTLEMCIRDSEGHGAAGQVIQAFGEVVIGGNYVVGIVVFAILMIINFVVVTKGAGRISEVSARFTLDAMPGKQMAIDADLNAGLIDQALSLIHI